MQMMHVFKHCMCTNLSDSSYMHAPTLVPPLQKKKIQSKHASVQMTHTLKHCMYASIFVAPHTCKRHIK